MGQPNKLSTRVNDNTAEDKRVSWQQRYIYRRNKHGYHATTSSLRRFQDLGEINDDIYHGIYMLIYIHIYIYPSVRYIMVALNNFFG